MTVCWGFKEADDAYNESLNFYLFENTNKFSSGKEWYVTIARIIGVGLAFKAYCVYTTPCEVWIDKEHDVSGIITLDYKCKFIKNNIDSHAKDHNSAGELIYIKEAFEKRLQEAVSASETDKGRFYWQLLSCKEKIDLSDGAN